MHDIVTLISYTSRTDLWHRHWTSNKRVSVSFGFNNVEERNSPKSLFWLNEAIMQIQNTSENGISRLQDCHHRILKGETIKVLSEDAFKTEKIWILDWHKQKVS